ncbi:MAG: 2-amino-4-hydroxy-6-hydroxymethyldihydropteridine diphosphokinase [Bacteroidaceae bacterium]|nr:2-amino-4-hydroxy-6-hydroxymethyldihydropteridine diphosphokinase [Bacteroidaceae bacterium]
MHIAYLGLGTNLGLREINLKQAIQALEQHAGRLLKCSSFMETAPWGFESSNIFLNGAVILETKLSPFDLLSVTCRIETALGRTHKSHDNQYVDRTMDIDILFYDQLILETPELIIPHPLIQNRLFVLNPLEEIAPDFVHPILHKSIHQMLLNLRQTTNTLSQ